MATKDACALLARLLAETTEREWLEFKINNINPEEIGEYVSALANSAMLADKERGYLVYGVEDKTHKAVGTRAHLATMKGKGNEGLQNWLDRHLAPKIYLECLDFECDGLNFSIVSIEPTYDRPVTFMNKAYIRIGEHKKLLSDHYAHERSLWLATNRRKFEDGLAATHLSASEISQKLDDNTYFDLTNQPRPKDQNEIMRKYEQIGAIRQNMEGGYDILNLGAILFAKNIDDFPTVRGKTVRVIRYKGNNKKSSEPEQVGQLGYAVGFKGLIRHIMSRSTIEVYEEGVRKQVMLCPEVAVREIVANALIHQDFTALFALAVEGHATAAVR